MTFPKIVPLPRSQKLSFHKPFIAGLSWINLLLVCIRNKHTYFGVSHTEHWNTFLSKQAYACTVIPAQRNITVEHVVGL